MARRSSSIDWRQLATAALRARRRAYAPYSSFRVGAALLARHTIHTGANVENATYGLCICAERAAVVKAINGGDKAFRALAVATQSHPPSPPCGLCLQTLAEFASDLPILLLNADGEHVQTSLRLLFPGAFSAKLLKS